MSNTDSKGPDKPAQIGHGIFPSILKYATISYVP